MSRSGAQRVIVALDDITAVPAAVDAAARLAVTFEARLNAFFLENDNLARAAALPFLHETCVLSGTVRPMAGGAVLRTLRDHAERMRATVAAAAEASGLPWQFEVVRGSGLAVVCTRGGALDVLVLAPAPRYLMTPECGAAFSGEAAVDSRPVAVTLRDVTAAARSLRAAQALAAACDAPLLFFLAGHDAERNRRLRDFAIRTLGTAAARARHVALPDWNVDALAAAARQHRARLVVCCDGGLRRDARRLEGLLARVRCPLVVAD